LESLRLERNKKTEGLYKIAKSLRKGGVNAGLELFLNSSLIIIAQIVNKL